MDDFFEEAWNALNDKLEQVYAKHWEKEEKTKEKAEYERLKKKYEKEV